MVQGREATTDRSGFTRSLDSCRVLRLPGAALALACGRNFCRQRFNRVNRWTAENSIATASLSPHNKSTLKF